MVILIVCCIFDIGYLVFLYFEWKIDFVFVISNMLDLSLFRWFLIILRIYLEYWVVLWFVLKCFRESVIVLLSVIFVLV